MAEVSPQERRRYERFPIYCPIEYKAEDQLPKESSVTLNVSEGGALISAKRDLSSSANLILKLRLRDQLFFIIGKVKHVRQEDNDNGYSIGVEFWDRPRTFTKKFQEELRSIQEYRKKYEKAHGSEISLAEASINWYKDTSNWLQ